MALLIENAVPIVKYGGLNTNTAVDFSGAPSVALPSATTIGGSSVVSLGNITSTSTTATAFSVTNTGIFTGASVQSLVADSATTGTIFAISGAGLTSGHGVVITSTGTIVTTGDLLSIVGNNATTTTGLVRVSATALTSGSAITVTGGTSLTSSGALITSNLGAATAGSGIDIITTGVYTDTTGILSITANSATSGVLDSISGTGLTTGTLHKATAAAATLTTGFYYAANDGALNVFTVGANGHITSNQTTAPTIAVTTQAGITAAAVTAGSTDVCGNITTTGTSAGGTVITLTFNKTYTVAPKFVVVNETNAAAVTGGIFVSSTTATTAVFTIPSASGATPSFSYFVIA